MKNSVIFPKEYLYSDFEYENDLRKAIDAYNDPEKKNRFFEISGDDELNKAKFVCELKKHFKQNQNGIVFETSGNIYLEKFPWSPFKELLYNFFELKKDEQLREKLFKFTKNFKENIAMQNIYISELFSKKEDNRKINLNTQIIFDAFRLFFLYASKNQKIFIILENIDNFDRQSLNLLDYLVRTLKKSNVYFAVTKNTRFTWSPKNIEPIKISLKNISEFNAFQIMKRIIGNEPSEELFNFVYEESKRNFYYLLTLLNYIKENDFLFLREGRSYLKSNFKEEYKNISSITNLVMLKINSLGMEEREILSVASALGNITDYDILKKVIDNENFENNFNNLAEFGFFRTDQTSIKKRVSFSNNETMDFVYQNISYNNKREIHQKIADITLKENENNLSDIYEILAYHYENAYSENLACYYYFLSGIKYRNIYDYDNGYKYLSKSLFIAKKIIKNDENVIFFNEEELSALNFQIEEQYFSYNIKFKLNIAVIYYFIAQSVLLSDSKSEDMYLKSLSYSRKYKDVQFIILNKFELFHKKLYTADSFLKDYIDDIHKLSKDYGKSFYMILSLIENILITLSSPASEEDKNILNNFYLAKRILDNPRVEMEDEERRILFVRWYFFYALYKKATSKYSKEDIEEIRDIVKKGEDNLLYENEKMNYYLKVSQSALDKTPYKLAYLQKSIDIALKINDTLHCIYNYSGLGYLYMLEKKYDQALDYSLKAIKLCEETDNRFEMGMIYKNIGELYISKNMIDEAIEYLNLSVSFKLEFQSCRIIDDFANIIFPYAYLAFCYIKKGDWDNARYYFSKTDKILPNVGMFSLEIPIFISFLKNYADFEETKSEEKKKNLKEDFDKLNALIPKPLFLDWINDILKIFT